MHGIITDGGKAVSNNILFYMYSLINKFHFFI